ncbi:TetR/AcrR family transcriptional regulator [Actinophytocola gossypii]|uniref:TetR/AcrR family transcriptional regulator n=1 Tax=Actinophytocola gossypii TaxID=2812003 RepID=A0ABT2JGM2_9PSEU|nr:TetR/AcrR family transcriptional regulator [Actinophytocola gossypii]MCT2586434.1 TetR/AcrR family transcriptional regulator [Actinophytocola gossypii]
MSVDERRRVKRLPREVRERQILDAAVRVFSAHGYHNASMDEVSDVAGVSKPMIYAYLGSKEDLFAACIHRESANLLDAVAGGVPLDLPPDMQLWHGLRAFFDYVGEQRASWRVLHRQAISQGGPFSEELLAMRRRAISLVDTLLVRTATKKGLDDNATEALAAALVGAAESLADWWLDHPEVPSKVIASRLMNLAWMGFGDLVEGRVWSPA